MYREANRSADCLANLACDSGSNLIVYESPPNVIGQVLLLDAKGVYSPRIISV